MSLLEGIFNRVRNVFGSENDELLFFILAFLLLFSTGLNGGCTDGTDVSDNGSILFFIVLFLILFIGSDYADDLV